jgi:hypothetical protein
MERCLYCGIYARAPLPHDPLVPDGTALGHCCALCAVRRSALARRMTRAPFVVVRPDDD